MVCNTRPQQASFQNPVFEVFPSSGFYADRFQQPQRILLGKTVLVARVLALMVVGQINKQHNKAFKEFEYKAEPYVVRSRYIRSEYLKGSPQKNASLAS